MTQLNQEHAEIRLSAFNMVVELFSRSHHFRVLLVANMQEFLDLTVETDTDLPLPPPKEVAQKLKRLAIQTVQSWHTTYGEAYKKLALGYHFLKQVKKVIALHCCKTVCSPRTLPWGLPLSCPHFVSFHQTKVM